MKCDLEKEKIPCLKKLSEAQNLLKLILILITILLFLSVVLQISIHTKIAEIEKDFIFQIEE